MERKEVTVTHYNYMTDGKDLPGIELSKIVITFDKIVPPHTVLQYDDLGERLMITEDKPEEFKLGLTGERVGYVHLAKWVTNNDPTSWYPNDKLYAGMKYYYYE